MSLSLWETISLFRFQFRHSLLVKSISPLHNNIFSQHFDQTVNFPRIWSKEKQKYTEKGEQYGKSQNLSLDFNKLIEISWGGVVFAY